MLLYIGGTYFRKIPTLYIWHLPLLSCYLSPALLPVGFLSVSMWVDPSPQTMVSSLTVYPLLMLVLHKELIQQKNWQICTSLGTIGMFCPFKLNISLRSESCYGDWCDPK